MKKFLSHTLQYAADYFQPATLHFYASNKGVVVIWNLSYCQVKGVQSQRGQCDLANAGRLPACQNRDGKIVK